MNATTTTMRHDRNFAALATPTDLDKKGVDKIADELRQLLADVFALYMKTKNFHWHMSGRSFRDYHLLLDEHSEQILAMTDDIAERGARSAAPRSARLATSGSTSGWRTTTKSSSHLVKCSPSCQVTISNSHATCERRTKYATNTKMWRRPA